MKKVKSLASMNQQHKKAISISESLNIRNITEIVLLHILIIQSYYQITNKTKNITTVRTVNQ